jgi:RHS repeat-associated protein
MNTLKLTPVQKSFPTFGMVMSGRSFTSDAYRYGFNGKEQDKEGMGGGASTYDYGFRIYNPGIAKFLSVDPLCAKFPWYSTFQFAGNKPIWCLDLDGQEDITYTTIMMENEDCSIRIVSSEQVLEKTGPLGSGVLNLVIFANTGDFTAAFNKNQVNIEAEGSRNLFVQVMNAVERFFDPKFGFEFSSENGSLSHARYGTGEKIEDIDALLAAVSGLHGAASMDGNPLMSTKYTEHPDDLNAAFDFWFERLGGIKENIEAVANSTRNVDDVTGGEKYNITVVQQESHPAIYRETEEEHLNIDEDSLKKVKETLGSKKEGQRTITRQLKK